MPILLILLFLAVPAKASLLNHFSPCCGGGYAISAQGLFSVTVTGGSGSGFAFPVLEATSNVFPGDSATSFISLGGISAFASQKCLGLCGLNFPSYVQGSSVPLNDLQFLIPFQFDQALVLPYSYSLLGSGYGPDGSVQLDFWRLFDSQGVNLTTASVRENGFVTIPEPSTLPMALGGGVLIVLAARRLGQKAHLSKLTHPCPRYFL